MAYLSDNFLFKNNIFLLNPLPNNANLLDNFSILHYGNFLIPRINLGAHKDQNFEHIFYSFKEKIDLKKNIIKDNDDICIEIDKSDNNMINDYKDDQKMSHNRNCLTRKKELNYDNYYNIKYNNDKYYKKIPNILLNEQEKEEHGNIEPLPPKRFIEIISDIYVQNKNKNNLKLSLNINDKNNIKIINNIIINNIHLIFNESYKIYSNNNIFDDNNIQKVDYPNFINYNFDNSQCSTSQTNFLFEGADKKKENKIKKKLFNSYIESQKIKNKNNNLISKKRRKRDSTKRIHSAGDDDNILRKIQVHFLSFIINYTNDVINTFFKDKTIPRFKNLDYKIKKTVNHRFVENLKSKKIGEILQLKVSPKMKINDETVNKNIFNIIWEKCPSIHDYLRQNYLSLFKQYYYNNNKIFEVNGTVINLSVKTKTFSDLIIKNFQYKEKMKFVSINYFLNCYKRVKKPNFKIHIFKK